MFDKSMEESDEKTPGGLGLNQAGRLSKNDFLRIMKKPGPLKYVLVQPSKIRA